MKKRVVVGMSGGVDSSLTAALLKQQGYEVIGLFMKNWDEKDEGVCTQEDDFNDVRRVAEKLDIPYYTKNFTTEYYDEVFSDFLTKLKEGKTPNPDILCNREIKFKRLLQAALELGADALATGHYAQNRAENGMQYLVRGIDTTKDQSYFLYTITQEALQKVLFPVGALYKTEVRKLAKELGLATAGKKDSTGICFIGKRKFKDFVNHYLPYQPGNFETLSGKVVGTHSGAAFYTIGQRRGLGLGGEGDAWYVVKKEMERNVVVVERGACHPALFADTLEAKEVHWITKAPTLPYTCTAKVRYRQNDQPCVIERFEENTLHVRFLVPQRAITLEQSVVFYDKEICLGGAIISGVGPSYYSQHKQLEHFDLPSKEQV